MSHTAILLSPDDEIITEMRMEHAPLSIPALQPPTVIPISDDPNVPITGVREVTFVRSPDDTLAYQLLRGDPTLVAYRQEGWER